MSGAVELVTFGCRVNAVESEAMRGHTAAAGLSDAVIVNTCAVTAEAVRQAKQTIRRLARERPGARIIVTGCAAQIAPATFASMPEVARVLGNAEKLRSASYRFAPQDAADRVRVDDIMSVRETAGHLLDGFGARARAFLEIQNGCDHRCTFCIIPFGRGPSRSVPPDRVIEQARRLVAGGTNEIVLTGVDLTAYGRDLEGAPALGRLVARLLAELPGLPRLRLSSLDAVEIDPELAELIAGADRLMPHLHLSLQAGDDLILKRMRRRHGRADAIRFCETVRARRPGLSFGADLIAGFPTETEAQFDRTRALVAECGLSFLHVFPFSPRAGTPAARMPQVPRAEVKRRAARLREDGAAALVRHLESRAGQTDSVLVESAGFARAEDFTPVRLAAAATPGTLLRVRITGHGDGLATAVPA